MFAVMRRIAFAVVVVVFASTAFLGATATATSPLTCSSPHKLTGYEGTLQLPPYTVQQDVWQQVGQQVMYVCSAANWEAIAKQSGAPSTGVKTYPDSGKTFTDWAHCSSQPKVSSFSTLSYSYGEVAPTAKSAWDYGSDIFLNGSVCNKALTEVMVWNQWSGLSVPNAQYHVTIDSVAYDIFHSGGYVQVRRHTQNAAGTINMVHVFNVLEYLKLVQPTDSMAFLQYGVEILTTYGVNVPFYLTNFSVSNTP